MKKRPLIIEVKDGKVWWVVADMDDEPLEVAVLNHDEGIIRDIPVDYRDKHYIDSVTTIIGEMHESGLFDEFERRLAKINPEFYGRLAKIRKEQSKKEQT